MTPRTSSKKRTKTGMRLKSFLGRKPRELQDLNLFLLRHGGNEAGNSETFAKSLNTRKMKKRKNQEEAAKIAQSTECDEFKTENV